jgi:hypothetical protein
VALLAAAVVARLMVRRIGDALLVAVAVVAMEAVATILGPPVHKFRPPCRMEPAPVQAES